MTFDLYMKRFYSKECQEAIDALFEPIATRITDDYSSWLETDFFRQQHLHDNGLEFISLECLPTGAYHKDVYRVLFQKEICDVLDKHVWHDREGTASPIGFMSYIIDRVICEAAAQVALTELGESYKVYLEDVDRLIANAADRCEEYDTELTGIKEAE